VLRRLEREVRVDPAMLDAYFRGLEQFRRVHEVLLRHAASVDPAPVFTGLADLMHDAIERGALKPSSRSDVERR
jgi:hypothetical protein